MSRGGKKLTKTEKQACQLRQEAQDLDALVKDTAAVFRCASETVEDCATECDRRCDDLEADLKYRRLAYDIWRERPGAEELASSMADLIAENERHLATIKQIGRRLDVLTDNATLHVHLGFDAVSDEYVRSRLFTEPAT